ncbi:hypothetical protein GCM10018793_29600 [Streptomyces sulfonofaciens]|uniref:L,D-transpeptidase n=1 Tax=Streptomyces sulfonofaciens TaxID=68272 RepID=A0A919KZS8_9ACTN|nr:hypothetical protein GCM10018793_29600 [Streptomyces sulfonofaciens]
MAGLTVAAVAGVGFLAYQASANAPDHFGAPGPGAHASPGATAHHAPRHRKDPAALPAHSGSGERIVYGLRADRVWLVGAGDHVQRTFTVRPSTVDPAPGTFTVTSRSAVVTGSDGVPIEHVVRFTAVDGVTIGFSAAVDGSTPEPDPARKTGGIRETRADGTALWDFADIGARVVVVP